MASEMLDRKFFLQRMADQRRLPCLQRFSGQPGGVDQSERGLGRHAAAEPAGGWQSSPLSAECRPLVRFDGLYTCGAVYVWQQRPECHPRARLLAIRLLTFQE